MRNPTLDDQTELPFSSGADARSLLDQLLADARLYTQSKDYKELLDFTVHLRNFAPFNAMLLQVQKPGLSYAASARDWLAKFGRYPKEGARPLLILWPFGPVALVYDVMDTEGDPLPQDVQRFFTRGSITKEMLAAFENLLMGKHIRWRMVDAGDSNAGSIRVVQHADKQNPVTTYRISLNRNHGLAVQFATLAHELGHLFLGHLGFDKILKIPDRYVPEHAKREIEAESVAYLVCRRNGVVPKSQTYLSNYVSSDKTVTQELDVYQIMRAAGQVEQLLGLTAPGQFDMPKKAAPKPEKAPAPFASLPVKSREAFEKWLQSGGAEGDWNVIRPRNKSLRAEFTRRTGVELPKGFKDSTDKAKAYFASAAQNSDHPDPVEAMTDQGVRWVEEWAEMTDEEAMASPESFAAGVKKVDQGSRPVAELAQMTDEELDSIIDVVLTEQKQEAEPLIPQPKKEAVSMVPGGQKEPVGPPEPREMTLDEVIKAAADLGVTGIDEALKGLYEMFGGGRVGIVPQAFNEESWRHASLSLRLTRVGGK